MCVFVINCSFCLANFCVNELCVILIISLATVEAVGHALRKREGESINCVCLVQNIRVLAKELTSITPKRSTAQPR